MTTDKLAAFLDRMRVQREAVLECRAFIAAKVSECDQSRAILMSEDRIEVAKLETIDFALDQAKALGEAVRPETAERAARPAVRQPRVTLDDKIMAALPAFVRHDGLGDAFSLQTAAAGFSTVKLGKVEVALGRLVAAGKLMRDGALYRVPSAPGATPAQRTVAAAVADGLIPPPAVAPVNIAAAVALAKGAMAPKPETNAAE